MPERLRVVEPEAVELMATDVGLKLKVGMVPAELVVVAVAEKVTVPVSPSAGTTEMATLGMVPPDATEKVVLAGESVKLAHVVELTVTISRVSAVPPAVSAGPMEPW
jgi:hypothetical protein